MGMRRISIIVVVFSLLLSSFILSGWGRGRDVKSAKVEIEFMNWERTPVGRRFINHLIKEFEKKNPHIKIKNTLVAGNYTSKLLTRFAAGNPPDIFEIQAEIIHPFLKKGLLLNLSPYIKNSPILNEEDFFPISLVNFRYDGKNFKKGDIYGFPKDLGVGALIYNKELFDKEGIRYPDENWTEKEYVDAAKKLTKRDESGRIIQIGIDRPINPLYILLCKGGSIWSSDYKKCLLDSKEGVEAFQFVYDLQEVHRVALPQSGERRGLVEAFGFKSGKAGMSLVWRFQLPDLVKYIGNRFRWAVAPIPLFNGKRIQLLHGPSGWAISKKTKHPEECFKFMEFLVGEEGQIETAKLGWNIPGNKRIAYSEYFLENLKREDSEEINRIFLNSIDELNPTLLNPYISISKFYTILDEMLDVNNIRKYGGRVDIPLKIAVERINKEIEENLNNE